MTLEDAIEIMNQVIMSVCIDCSDTKTSNTIKLAWSLVNQAASHSK